MKMAGRVVIMISLLFLAQVLLFTGCPTKPSIDPGTATGQITNPDPASDTIADVTLRNDWIVHPAQAGQLLAIELGIFQKHRLKVEVKPGGQQADPVRMVASGSDDFGLAGADAVLLARAQGVPIVAIAAEFLQSPGVFFSKPAITEPQQFPGHKVAVLTGNPTETLYLAVIRKLGIDRTKIKEVPAGFDPRPFIAGDVDVWTPGWVNNEPYTLDKQGTKYNIIEPSKYGIEFLGPCYFTTEKMIQEKPEIVQAFVDAVIEGWEQTYGDIDAAVKALAKYDENEKSEEYTRWVLTTQQAYICPEGRKFCDFSPQEWDATYRVLRDEGVLDKDIDVRQAYADQFLQAHYGAETDR